jgi:hypothetical protein
LVGSSSSSRLGRCHTISASARRAFSPPEKGAIGLVTMVAREVEAAQEVAQLLLAHGRRDLRRCHSGDSSWRSISTWCWAK